MNGELLGLCSTFLPRSDIRKKPIKILRLAMLAEHCGVLHRAAWPKPISLYSREGERIISATEGCSAHRVRGNRQTSTPEQSSGSRRTMFDYEFAPGA